MYITPSQRRALKRIYDRFQLFLPAGYTSPTTACRLPYPLYTPLTYRQFRNLVQPTFGCDGAVTVPWCSMWLCIERDGYTHS